MMSKLKYATIFLILFPSVICYSQSGTIPITIMTYNTSDDGSNWTDTDTIFRIRNVISAVNPDIIVAVEINNNNTDDFLAIMCFYGSSYSKGTFIANTTYSPNSNCSIL